MIYTLYLIAIYTFITLNMFIAKAPILQSHLFLQSHVQFMSSRSLVTLLLMLEDSIVDKYFFLEYT